MSFLLPTLTDNAIPPINDLGEKAQSVGHLITLLDIDGGVRAEPLVVSYYDKFFPSQSLMIAAASLNLDVNDIKINLAESVELGRLKIKTDEYLTMNTFFYRKNAAGGNPFAVYSFYDVIQDNIPVENFKDKIVLIGATAFGLGSNLHTPLGDVGGPVLIMAHTVASILNEHFFVQPSWASLAELLTILLIAVYLIFVLPRLKAGPAALVSLILLALLLGSEAGFNDVAKPVVKTR